MREFMSAREFTSVRYGATHGLSDIVPRRQLILYHSVPPYLSDIVPPRLSDIVSLHLSVSDRIYRTTPSMSVRYRITLSDVVPSVCLFLLDTVPLRLSMSVRYRTTLSVHVCQVERGRRAGKHVVVAGCVPQGAPRSDYLHGLSVIGVQQIDRVVEVVEETLKGRQAPPAWRRRMGLYLGRWDEFFRWIVSE